MKLLILLHHRFELWNPPDWFAERLRQEFPQVDVVHLRSYEGAESELREAEVLVTWSLRREQFAAAERLRWIHSPAAAVHQLMIPQLVASDVILTNARSVHGPVVAEHAIAMLLALAKKLPQAMRCQAKRVWSQQQLWEHRPRPREVAGATLAVIGLGSIGAETARLASALGMRVLAVREHPERGRGFAAEVFGYDQLARVLGQADYVLLAAPLTPRTCGLMNAERLRQMKPDAYLINVGRGALVDEPALIQTLRQRKLAGAALDVFSAEPLPSDSPLWDLDNVLITPHTAAVTDRLWARHYELLSDNLRRFLGGEPLRGVVDKQKGY